MSRKVVQEYLGLLNEVEEIERAILECIEDQESKTEDLVSKQSRMLHLRVTLSETLNKNTMRHPFLFDNRIVLVERHERGWPTITVSDLEEEMSLGDRKEEVVFRIVRVGEEHYVDGKLFEPKGLRRYRKKTLTHAVQMLESFSVETPEGTMTGKAGDWLMVGVNGEMYPCDAAVFEKTYKYIPERSDSDECQGNRMFNGP